MKNVILIGGIAIIVYAMIKRNQSSASGASVAPIVYGSGAGAGSSGVDADCSLCNTLGGDSTISTSPQIPSPSADPVINYAIERMDFNGPRILAQ